MGEPAEIVELVGTSTESWEDAARNAMNDADEPVEHVSGVAIESETTETGNGAVERYTVTLEAAVALEDR